ncbi:MAG TPA: hypothetical protein PK403_13385, partial [Plasticicumulans sp.]|nr:hypothetical protein [Plasticicumulans sp.]
LAFGVFFAVYAATRMKNVQTQMLDRGELDERTHASVRPPTFDSPLAERAHRKARLAGACCGDARPDCPILDELAGDTPLPQARLPEDAGPVTRTPGSRRR